MSTALGKRKRKIVEHVGTKQIQFEVHNVEDSTSGEDDDEDEDELRSQSPINSSPEPQDAQEIFRRHFEARFAPLADVPMLKRQALEVEEEDRESKQDEDSEWGGISEGDEDRKAIQVIEHTNTTQSLISSMSKEEYKIYMVCAFLKSI
jgi:hypothetical protein